MDLSSNPKAYINNRIELIKKDKAARIAELLAQIDRLQARINAQKEELKEELLAEFLHLESQIEKLPEEKRAQALEALEECKLKSLELLGILSETTESAMIAALEKGENIQETITEIAKNLTYESLDFNVEKERIEHIASTILEVAANLAVASPNYADEILRGAIHGVKRGIQKSIEKFHEVIEFTPPEARELLILNYQKVLDDLEQVDQIYRSTIEKVANKSEPGVQEKILEIASSESIFEKLTEEAQKAIATFKNRFAAILESPELKAKAIEAKELGLKAFTLAKEKIDKAIKEAKDALHK